MKILKSQTGQTKRVVLRENNSVDVFIYADQSNSWDLWYSVNGGLSEFEMQAFYHAE